MELVCLDNHILIWGIKEEATAGQEDMVHKAKLFFEWLDKSDFKAIIPANVLAEFLTLIPHEAHKTVINLCDKYFIIAPFDTAAASCFATILQRRSDDGTIKQLKDSGHNKNKITFDCQIVAVAITRGASCIYSYDKGLVKFAKGYIDVKEMPDMVEQLLIPGSQMETDQ